MKPRWKRCVESDDALLGEIRALDWMSPETKKRALEKLATFNPKVGYPDKWKDYSSVAIGPSSHW